MKEKIKSVINLLKNNSEYKMSNQNINYDELFKDIDGDIMAYLKNYNLLTEYVNLKSKFSNTNDILWSLYNDIKLQCEYTNNMYGLRSVLNHMGNLLFTENRNALDYSLSEFYCSSLAKKLKNIELGTTKEREIKTLLNGKKLTYDMFSMAIMELIPKFYDEEKLSYLFKILEKI